MTWWQALILGLVQGITEYLPVSSSGHLILTAEALGLRGDDAARAAMNTFDLALHVGTILAVAGLYWARVRQMTVGILGGDPVGRRLAGQLMLAFLPVAIVGYLFKGPIRDHLYGPWPIVAALVAGGVLMLAVHHHAGLRRSRVEGPDIESVTWMMALAIGLAQVVALWPGTSRSMMTLVAALVLGLRARAAAEFSFLLGMITITAITAVEILKDGRAMLEHLHVGPVLVGFVAATLSAAAAVKWFVGFLTNYGLGPFGWYRIALGVILIALLLAGFLDAGAFS